MIMKLLGTLPQEETVRQKPGVLAVIEELGKLEPLMAEAAVEEVNC